MPSRTSPGAALVEQATSSPTQFGFGEVLAQPPVRALATAPAGSPDARAHQLARLFACGTWLDYTASPLARTLTAAQEQKLKLLSLVSLVASRQEMQYAEPSVLSAIGCTDARQAETLIADAIATGLLTGHIDEPSKTLYIAFVSASRDLSTIPSASAPDLASLATKLDQWVATIQRAQQALARQKEQIRQEPDRKLAMRTAHEDLIASRMPLALWQSANKPKGRTLTALEHVDRAEGRRGGSAGKPQFPRGNRPTIRPTLARGGPRVKRSRQGHGPFSAPDDGDDDDVLMEE